MTKHAIFLEGPIGVGKTTLGRALAARISGEFIDGDDFSDPARAWYSSILQTSRAIVRAGHQALTTTDSVVIAYPLRRTNWIYFRGKFAELGVKTHVVGLNADYTTIIDHARGRIFNADERDRIREMLAEGYGRRAFANLVIETGDADVSATLRRLEHAVRLLL